MELTRRRDLLALWGGIAFTALWTGLIWLAGNRLTAFPKLPDQGASWYFWKLASPTFVSRFSAWTLYILHQCTIWGLIAYAQTHGRRYVGGLHRENVLALGANALFILLHFVQTHLWYDGLAQDTSVFSSQGSVVLMLVWILLMENQRRGLFWGRKVPIWPQVTAAARRYHGYIFSWAIVFTFWFHPMENSSGHLIGFVYMFLLMLQGSLFFTRIHVNRVWTVVQEALVLFHGTLVALMNTGTRGIWPMFAFGFAGIFIITQMHGIGLRLWHKLAFLALYIAAVAVTYAWRGFEKLDEIVRIPAIEYLAVFVLAGLIWLVLQAIRLRSSRRTTSIPLDAP